MSDGLQSNHTGQAQVPTEFPTEPDQLQSLSALIPISPYPAGFLRSFELLCESRELGYRLSRHIAEPLTETFRGAGQTFEEEFLSKFLDLTQIRNSGARCWRNPIDIFYDTAFGAVRYNQSGERESLALLVHITDRSSGRSGITDPQMEDCQYFIGNAANIVQFSSRYPAGYNVTPLFSDEAFSEARADLVSQLNVRSDRDITGYLYRLYREQAFQMLAKRGVDEERIKYLIRAGTRAVSPHVLFDPEARYSQGHSSRELYQAVFFGKGNGVVGCRLEPVGYRR